MLGRPSALSLLDDAFHLLRELPAGAWLLYFCAVAPLLLFVAAQAQNLRYASAIHSLPQSAAFLALLYLLFGAGRIWFAGQLTNKLRRQPASALQLRPLSNQLLLHALELGLLPCAALSVVGFPWVLSLFRFVMCAQEERLRVLVRQSARRASEIYRQSWIVALIAAAVVLVMMLNMVVGLLMFPEIFKALSGYETPLTRSGGWAGSPLVLLVVFGIALWLAEALLLACSALVLFQEEAQTSGRDLLLRLKDTPEAQQVRQRTTPALGKVLLLAVVSLLMLAPESVCAASQQNLRPADLDRQIDQVLHDGKYRWIAGEQHPPDQSQNGPLHAVEDLMQRALHGIGYAIQSFLRWLEGIAQRQPPPSPRPSRPPYVPTWLLIGLSVVAAGVAIAVLFHARGRRSTGSIAVTAVESRSAVDLEDEQLLASALPEDEWLALAARYREQGDGRMAVRALYLAELAALARGEWLTITPYKTTADYRAELLRRSRSSKAVELFASNGRRYESVWYGFYPAPAELVKSFEQDLRSLRELAHV